MGQCARCGVKTGILSGSKNLLGNEYCSYCYTEEKLYYSENLLAVLQEKYGVPPDSGEVFYQYGFFRIPSSSYHIWVKDKNFCFFPSTPKKKEEDYVFIYFAVSDIEYYVIEGETTGETAIPDVHKSSNVGLENEVAANMKPETGGVGRKDRIINAQNPKTAEDDQRKTNLHILLDGIKRNMYFRYEDYGEFYKIIPDKAYCNVKNS